MNRFRCPKLVWLAVFNLVGFAAFSAESSGPTEPAKEKGPKAQFSEMRFDFGKVAPSEAQQHDFIVKNVGSEPLEILEVRPGCGCTTASEWDRQIQPGKSGKIPIVFNPANFSGSVTKSIIVTSNDAAQPTQILEIHAVVWRRLEVAPTFATFLPVADEPAKETKVVRILNHSEEDVALENPQSTSSEFKTELKALRPGKEFELHVSYEAAVPKPSAAATISIKTSDPAQPVLNVSALVMPQPAVVVIPAAIFLPDGRMDPGQSHNVVIRSNGNAPLQVTEAAASSPGVTTKIIEAQPGKIFYVNVALPQNFTTSAEHPIVVSVKTSHPRHPAIRIPILPAPEAASAAVQN